MTPVFQRVVDKGTGDCLRACVCSLLDKIPEEIPNFFDYNEETGSSDFWMNYEHYLRKFGYEQVTVLYNPKLVYLDNPTEYCREKCRQVPSLLLPVLHNYEGVDNYYIGIVHSPAYTNNGEPPHAHTHAVIVNDCYSIVHDPNPNNSDVIMYPYAELIGYNGIRNIYVIQKIQ